ncbi:MAG: Asp-tRNA(Asn)/Glu-tRNA(Gln) amidotransferase subunit GatA [Clostridia bacterium]|nr:Asp-tRNA(Asn)/Glu-tRNA(Gln) amidotransferase subunit GatA [Clostridia bacterium]
MNPSDMTVRGLIDALHNRQLSAAEVTEDCLQRIRHAEPALHAFLACDEALARSHAAEADRMLQSGDAARLCGIPFAAKDNICTTDFPTTCSSRMLEGYRSPFDAFALTRLKGAVCVGKTNMDEFAMGSSTEHSAFGPTRNPYDIARVPGGSSGGSACAVAAGMVPFALGSDTGGSVRQPAAFCGVVGMRPTYGSISRRGLVAFASSLDQIGPITRNAADNALILEALCAHDAQDATSVIHPRRDFSRLMAQPLNGLRISIVKEMMDVPMQSAVREAVTSAVHLLEKLGAKIVTLSIPAVADALPAYYIISGAEASSNLARYDGIRFGHRAENCTTLEEVYLRSRSEGFGQEVKRRILTGTHVLSAGYYQQYYAKAQRVRSVLKYQLAEAFRTADVLISPTAPETAFRLGEKQSPVSLYAGDIHTVPAAMAGIPALSIPCGKDSGGLPIGLQLMAPAFCEELLYQAAYALERETGTGADICGEVRV